MDQLFYEDIGVGQEIPHLVKKPTITQQVMYQACMWLWHRIHYDKDFSQSLGFSDAVVIGQLEADFLAQMLTDWIGERGMIQKLAFRALQVCTVGDTLACSGKVTRKYVQNGGNYVDCDLLITNQQEETKMSGNATLGLPSKPQA